MEPHQQEFSQMPGITDNPLGASFRQLSEEDTKPRAMLWSSISVGLLVVAVGVYFLGDWLGWF